MFFRLVDESQSTELVQFRPSLPEKPIRFNFTSIPTLTFSPSPFPVSSKLSKPRPNLFSLFKQSTQSVEHVEHVETSEKEETEIEKEMKKKNVGVDLISNV